VASRYDLDVAECLETLLAVFNSKPGCLMAAKWDVRVQIEVLVDPNSASIEPTRNGFELNLFVSPIREL
jgi:hypothetical protein